MEAVNDSLKLIAKSIEMLKQLDNDHEDEVIDLLTQAVDKLATCST